MPETRAELLGRLAAAGAPLSWHGDTGEDTILDVAESFLDRALRR